MKALPNLQIIPVDNRGQLSEAYNARIDELKVLDIAFLTGSESAATVAVLYQDNKGARHVKSYAIDAPRKASGTGSTPSLHHSACGLHAQPLMCRGQQAGGKLCRHCCRSGHGRPRVLPAGWQSNADRHHTAQYNPRIQVRPDAHHAPAQGFYVHRAGWTLHPSLPRKTHAWELQVDAGMNRKGGAPRASRMQSV